MARFLTGVIGINVQHVSAAGAELSFPGCIIGDWIQWDDTYALIHPYDHPRRDAAGGSLGAALNAGALRPGGVGQQGAVARLGYRK
ncbi:MAG: hypothetical protein OXH85_12200 [Truepera sp.]|nr:hypothetical protein [Truepera sp.]